MGEIEYLIRVLSGKTSNSLNPPEQSAHTIYLVEKCFESAEQNSAILEVASL